MMMEAERRAALATLIRDIADMRNRAKLADLDFLASMLEDVLRETRSTLLGEGHQPPPPAAERSASVVLPMQKPRKPHRPR